MNDRPFVSWLAGGLLLGGLLLVAVAAARPLGVSTQYVSAVAGACELAEPGTCASHPYFKEEKIGFGYSEVLVLAIPLGAFLAAWATRRLGRRDLPEPWAARFGPSRARRFAAAALGGFLLLFGARLAGGCTSGHVLSGVSQLAVSSFLFSVAAFGVAVLTARTLYREVSS
jgi:uncharacterized membrane protein YedE/YeeE